MDITADMALLTGATWLIVQTLRPYLDGITARIPGVRTKIKGREVWLLVFFAACATTTIYANNAGETLRTGQLLWNGISITIGAVGLDKIVQVNQSEE